MALAGGLYILLLFTQIYNVYRSTCLQRIYNYDPGSSVLASLLSVWSNVRCCLGSAAWSDGLLLPGVVVECVVAAAWCDAWACINPLLLHMRPSRLDNKHFLLSRCMSVVVRLRSVFTLPCTD